MTALFALKVHAVFAPFTLTLTYILLLLSWRHPGVLARVPSSRQQIALSSNNEAEPLLASLIQNRENTTVSLPSTLGALLDAIDVMQEKYFEIGLGTWPDSIDWTAAVLGTHVSATLSTLISSIDSTTSSTTTCADTLAWDNLINRYFAHTSVFYFGENALSIRQQAYDDILWVVLGWLENIKLMDLYTSLRSKNAVAEQQTPWHGTQFKPAAAHRARLFYDLATHGWDTSLCGGGMVWSPHLRPYKNSITNELFISASVSMYLYFPGDDNDSPFFTTQDLSSGRKPHSHQYLENAIDAYVWLKSSNMKSPDRGTPGLYADGFHISGWRREPSGRINPGTGRCDDLNTMVYTYNQGVVMSGLRGLWLATGESSYLNDGHDLIDAVVEATGWWSRDRKDGMKQWAGLGRGGVLEEYCDASGWCSQNGHTFKGIFFHHLAEFCRPLWELEEDFMSNTSTRVGPQALGSQTWKDHLTRCDGYREWVKHNAHAAALTRDEEGRFGMWWGRAYPDDAADGFESPPLPLGAVDHENNNSNNCTNSTEFKKWSQERGLTTQKETICHPQQVSDTPDTGLDLDQQNEGVGRRSRRRSSGRSKQDVNDRGRGRTVETQSGGLAVLRALWQWESVVSASVAATRESRDGGEKKTLR
jgi:Glycosyl hydrolase family 76